MKILFVLAVIIAITLYDGLLTRGKPWRERVAIGILMKIALFLAIGNELALPAPIAVLDEWLSPIGKVFFTHNES